MENLPWAYRPPVTPARGRGVREASLVTAEWAGRPGPSRRRRGAAEPRKDSSAPTGDEGPAPHSGVSDATQWRFGGRVTATQGGSPALRSAFAAVDGAGGQRVFAVPGSGDRWQLSELSVPLGCHFPGPVAGGSVVGGSFCLFRVSSFPSSKSGARGRSPTLRSDHPPSLGRRGPGQPAFPPPSGVFCLPSM